METFHVTFTVWEHENKSGEVVVANNGARPRDVSGQDRKKELVLVAGRERWQKMFIFANQERWVELVMVTDTFFGGLRADYNEKLSL